MFAGSASAQRFEQSREILREQAAAQAEAFQVAVGAPARVNLLDQGSLRLSGDSLRFIPREAASRYLRAYQRAQPGDLVGLIIDGAEPDRLAVVRFIDEGCVPADTVRQWAADDILVSLRDEIARQNSLNTERGQPLLELKGWLVSPRFDPDSHTLAWAASIPPVDASRERDVEATYHIISFGRDG